jgi:3-oxoacyl-[acyl-carrier protein] reductase
MSATSSVEFNGQVVVISGAATGIGKSSAQLIAARGAKVIAIDFIMDIIMAIAKDFIMDIVISYSLNSISL